MTRSTSFSRPTRGSSEPSDAACVRSRLNSASNEVSFGRAAAVFSPDVRASSSRSVESRNPRSKALFFAQDPQQQMLGSDVFVAEPLGFFRRHIKDALALRAERHFDGRRDALAYRDARFDLFAYRFDRALLAEETVGQRLVLAHQAEQQMLRLDVRAAILAGFVPRKKYDASRFLCITFEHVSSLLPW